jgi:hypothetical protein
MPDPKKIVSLIYSKCCDRVGNDVVCTVRYCHIYEGGLAGEVLEDVQQDLEGVSTVKLALTLVRLQ